MKKTTIALGIFLLVLTHSLRSSAQACAVGDSLALVDLYNSTGGPSWINHTNWLTSNPVSTWFGVQADPYGDSIRVIFLILDYNNLVGTLPSTIGNLTALGQLVLPFNRLYGSVPASMNNLLSCFVDMSHNQLSGGMLPPFPQNTVVSLNIAYNNFTFATLEPSFIAAGHTGLLPLITTDSAQADLPLIQQGNLLSVAAGGTLADNTYTWYKDGAVVTTKTGDSTLNTDGTGGYSVTVSNSNVPNLTLYSIQNLNTQDSLALVDLYNSTLGANWVINTNWLTSAPAATWSGVTARFGRVDQLNMVGNNLAGSIPSSLGNLQAATIINFNINQLSGQIPASLGSLQSLNSLELGENQLSGSIPSSLGNLNQLLGLGLGDNQLTGAIPVSLSNLTNLYELDLDQNQLSGSIPAVLANMTNLQSLDLSFNQLSDTIPSSLGILAGMVYLSLNNNLLTGQIPNSFGRFKHLVQLDLNGNLLTGSIPDSICNSNIAHLWLNDNKLTGTIPDSMGRDTALVDFQVRNNNLSGTVMANFDTTYGSAGEYYLASLDISGNKYTYSALPIPMSQYGQLTYAPQQSIPLARVESTLSVSAGGNSTSSTYTLYKDGVSIATQTGDSAFSIQGLGNYNIVSSNPIGPLLTLYSDTLKLGLVLPDSTITATQTITGSGAIDINSNIFRLVTITPTAGVNGVSGDVTTSETIDPSIQTYNGAPYVTRHYDITPTSNPATSQATVTLYYTQADFDAYNAYVTANNLNLPLLPTGGVDNGNIVITQYHGTFTGSSSPGNYSQGSEEINPTVNWDGTDGWWIVSFPVSGFSGFFLSTGSVPLPLTLLDFTAVVNDYTADLQWKTTDEQNTSVFIVQRSMDGIVFNPIGSVAAKNTIGQNVYGFTDSHPLTGDNFYQLKMQDRDGQFTNSPIVEVSIALPDAGLSTYPNPATSATSLLFQSGNAASYTIQVADVTGKLLIQLTGRAAIGLNKIELDVHSFAPGTYTLTLIDEQHGRRSIQLLKE